MLVMMFSPFEAYTPQEERPLLVIFKAKGDVTAFVSGKKTQRTVVDLVQEKVVEVELSVSGVSHNEREALLVLEEKHFENFPEDPMLAVLGIENLETSQMLTDLVKTTLGKHLTRLRAQNGGISLAGFGLERKASLLVGQVIGRSHIYYVPPKPFDKPSLPCKNGVIGVTTRDESGQARVVPLGGSNPVRGLESVKNGKRRPHEILKAERRHSKLANPPLK